MRDKSRPRNRTPDERDLARHEHLLWRILFGLPIVFLIVLLAFDASLTSVYILLGAVAIAGGLMFWSGMRRPKRDQE